jgi:hypothetical protein
MMETCRLPDADREQDAVIASSPPTIRGLLLSLFASVPRTITVCAQPDQRPSMRWLNA